MNEFKISDNKKEIHIIHKNSGSTGCALWAIVLILLFTIFGGFIITGFVFGGLSFFL